MHPAHGRLSSGCYYGDGYLLTAYWPSGSGPSFEVETKWDLKRYLTEGTVRRGRVAAGAKLIIFEARMKRRPVPIRCGWGQSMGYIRSKSRTSHPPALFTMDQEAESLSAGAIATREGA